MSKLDELLAEFEKQAAAHAGGDLIYVRDFQREYDLLREALRERAGMVLVPREPTATMRLRGSLAIQDHYRRDGGWCGLASAQEQMHLTWNAMLAAAEGKK